MKKRLLVKISVIAILSSLVIGSVLYFSNKSSFSADDLDGVSYHGGDITILGDYIFYNEKSNVMGSYLAAKNVEDGTTKTVSSCSGWSVYLYNNKLYYSSPHSLNPDNRIVSKELNGFLESKINNIPLYRFLIDGDYLYYNPSWKMGDDKIEERGHVFRINLKNRQEEKVLSYEVEQFWVCGEYLYFTQDYDESYDLYKKFVYDGIYRYSLQDHSEEKIVDDIVGEFCIENGDLFYAKYITNETTEEESAIYDLIKLDLDTNKTNTLINDIVAFYIFNDNICYVKTENHDIINILNVTSNKNKIVKADGLDYSKDFVFLNDRIYYYNSQDEFCEELIK